MSYRLSIRWRSQHSRKIRYMPLASGAHDHLKLGTRHGVIEEVTDLWLT